MIRPISESLFRLFLLTTASISFFSAPLTIAQSSAHPSIDPREQSHPQPINAPTRHLNQPVSQSGNPSTNHQSTNQSVSQLASQPGNQPGNPSVKHSVKYSVSQLSHRSHLLQSTPLVITEVRLWSAGKGAAWAMGQMTVPDFDTTRRADPKSPLRNYDRHVAHLFEMTYQQCEKNSGLNGMIWQYEAANGNVSMGRFRLHCQTSREIVSGYHLIPAHPQRIKTLSPANGRWIEQRTEVPQLHIVGNKAERWLDYVQTIPAIFTSAQKRLESMQAFPDDRIQRSQTFPTIPLRVPTVLPKVLKVADRFIVKSEKNSYHLCPATAQGECDRSSLYSFHQITGHQGRNFYDPKTLTPGAIYRPIELAHKTPGIYLENCVGQRCLSIVQWKQQGILYEIQSQYREQPVLIKLANSAIDADPIPAVTLQVKNDLPSEPLKTEQLKTEQLKTKQLKTEQLKKFY